ncbi:hypothetical protein Bca4012_092894 [Brassica carinata]|uniref:Uncharacterized protein n=1 Tax=Brassica carinata TaxID=52824 RepID=A0A8X7PQM7_BRACI|nr:hypothetical protein Bca52824_075169 [Brassica carinata]
MTSTVALRLESKRGSVVGSGVVKSASTVQAVDVNGAIVCGCCGGVWLEQEVQVFLVLGRCEDIASLFLPGAVRGKLSGSSKLRSLISSLLLKLEKKGVSPNTPLTNIGPSLAIGPAFCHRIPEQSESAVTAVLLIQVARLRGVDVCKCITTASLMLRLRGLPL